MRLNFECRDFCQPLTSPKEFPPRWWHDLEDHVWCASALHGRLAACCGWVGGEGLMAGVTIAHAGAVSQQMYGLLKPLGCRSRHRASTKLCGKISSIPVSHQGHNVLPPKHYNARCPLRLLACITNSFSLPAYIRPQYKQLLSS